MGLSMLAQPADNYPVGVRLAPRQDAVGSSQSGHSDQSNSQQNPSGSPQDQAANSQQRQAYGQGQPIITKPLCNAPARHSSIAAEQEAAPSNRPVAQRTEVQVPAPEIDWDYAVIERLDAETLKTKLIPFDLGKLVLKHDTSQDLELQPNDVVSIFSEADIRVPIAQQTKLIRLDGEFVHSGVYSVLPGETLRQLVERAGGFTPNAYLFGSEFTRQSTRAVQQTRIDEYVQSMNLSIQRGTLALVAAPDMLSPAGSGQQRRCDLHGARTTGQPQTDSRYRPRGAGIQARQHRPRFRSRHGPGGWRSFRGSIRSIQRKRSRRRLRPELIPLCAGAPGRVSYLHLAGGPNKDAESGKPLPSSFVPVADGEVISYEMSKGLWGNEFDDLPMNPGDTVVVPDKTLKPSVLRGVFDYTQLFSQFALGAAALSIIAP